MDRPDLNKSLSGEDFLKYYFLKEELMAFCKTYHLPISGSKSDLNERIALFLKEGIIIASSKKNRVNVIIQEINELSIIESPFVCTEKHRNFFEEKIGRSFTFNVAFQKWLKSHAGKTYMEAIDAYEQIRTESKRQKTRIDKQFEYNTYIRDFYAENSGKTLKDAIECWKYKKNQAGKPIYEASDLKILNDLKRGIE